MNFFAETGEFLCSMVAGAGRGAVLFGRSVVELPDAVRRWRAVLMQIFVCGVASLPVVTITALFSGMVISGQTGVALRRQQIVSQDFINEVLGRIVGAAMVVEMGPVLAGVMVAGFVGGGMASVVATMKVSEEVDALDVMGVSPVSYLVVPRLVAMIVAMPLLSVYADLVGIGGGAAVAHYTIDVPWKTFYEVCWDSLRIRP